MDLNNVRRVPSAGYQLPDRAYGTRPVTTQQPADRTRHAEPNPDRRDPVKQDQVWKEAVWGERSAVREWEKNWSFLNYDEMGQLKPEPLPSYVSLFSSRVPNTSSQLVGSRLSTPLGSELVRLDRLLLWSHHKCLRDPELLPA
ncbi:hypothetical protein VZT92_008436 [Zoarces viviparus]|uniref:Uncharacterized protein n=1 Tax=Zoarces viviparus TaxID=48416 RepID=A0AAW1FEE7_ZOAVI